MIAAEHARLPATAAIVRRRMAWSSRLSAVLLVAAVVASLGGGGMLDVGSAYLLKHRADILSARCAYMLDNWIASSELVGVRQERTITHDP